MSAHLPYRCCERCAERNRIRITLNAFRRHLSRTRWWRWGDRKQRAALRADIKSVEKYLELL